jgi:ABC-2 type transport system permease protein
MTTQQQAIPSADPVTASLADSTLWSELRAFAAVIKRRMTIFIRYPSWVISLIMWPLIFPAAYIFSAKALSGPDGSGLAIFLQSTGIEDYIGYIVVGTTIWMWQNVVLWNVGGGLRQEQTFGTLESNWLTPTWRFSYLLGNGVTQLVIMLLMLTVAALEFNLIFGVQYDGNLWLVLLTLAISILPIYGIGFVFASLVLYAKEANAFVFLIRGIVMVFAGVTYPVSITPGWMQTVAKWIPQSYIMSAFRKAALGGADFNGLKGDFVVILGMGIFWLIAGYLTFKWMEKQTHRTGSIGYF